jgi:EAL domain-containing protein (putative c-di-GMP-specific phosphodiesterase class I)
MQAIAEGVDTEGQLGRLRELGCDLAQGFHILRPGDAATIARFVPTPGSRPRVRFA